MANKNALKGISKQSSPDSESEIHRLKDFTGKELPNLPWSNPEKPGAVLR
jgi:hypothetical protein